MSDHPDTLAASYELIDQLQEALASRDLIGQAKGILMARGSTSDDEAFAMLVRASQRQNQKVRDVAGQVVQANNDRYSSTDRVAGAGPGESTALQDATALLTVAMDRTATEELGELVAEFARRDEPDALVLALVTLCRSLCMTTATVVCVLDGGLSEAEADGLTEDDLLPTARQVVRSYANAAARNESPTELAGRAVDRGRADQFEPGSAPDRASP